MGQTLAYGADLNPSPSAGVQPEAPRRAHPLAAFLFRCGRCSVSLQDCRERCLYDGAVVPIKQCGVRFQHGHVCGLFCVSGPCRRSASLLAAHEAPPSPVFLRDGHGRSAPVPVPPSGANGLGERWTAALEPLDSRAEEEKDQGAITDSAATGGKPKPASPRKPTFLQRERWKAIQKARRKGLSLRAIERELGIHRATIKKYLDAEGPPTRHDLAAPATSSSDTMAT